MDRKKRIGIIGCGHWGPNQIHSFYLHPEVNVVRICDINPDYLNINKAIYKDVETTQKSEDITQASDIDVVVVCTPTSTHYSITKEALLNGKDVLCEKPLTIHVKEAEELINIANKNKLILMLAHVFVFNQGIIKLKELIKTNECGDIYYMYSQRTNLGPIRNDVNVIYDLASHDIYIFNFLLDSLPIKAFSVAKSILRPNIEDIAFISLEYPKNILVQIHVSWLDPKKIREITVVGNKKMITWNDIAAGSIEIFSKHVERKQVSGEYEEFQLVAKGGEVVIPHIQNMQPLKLQTDHFINCIKKREEPISNAQSGLEVVKILKRIMDNTTSDKLIKI